MIDFTLDELCVVACAEAWRGDGEILASPIGIIPAIGARLAQSTFAPDLLLTDGMAMAMRGPTVESWLPYRTIFDIVGSGKRHVMMGAAQIDRFGNQNIAGIGDWQKPKAQLVGVRGAPGNTINHTTSYWISQHSRRVFVPKVDFVCGIGHDRARALGKSGRFHALRHVVTNKCVFDFDPHGCMRLKSLHPGVTLEDVLDNTGFEITHDAQIPTTRAPTDEECQLIRTVLDPQATRRQELR